MVASSDEIPILWLGLSLSSIRTFQFFYAPPFTGDIYLNALLTGTEFRKRKTASSKF